MTWFNKQKKKIKEKIKFIYPQNIKIWIGGGWWGVGEGLGGLKVISNSL